MFFMFSLEKHKKHKLHKKKFNGEYKFLMFFLLKIKKKTLEFQLFLNLDVLNYFCLLLLSKITILNYTFF